MVQTQRICMWAARFGLKNYPKHIRSCDKENSMLNSLNYLEQFNV